MNPDPKANSPEAEEQQRLLSLFSRLTQTERQFVLRVVRGLLEFN
ncbi:hypothetical protein CLV76_1112 [Marivita geojedonensis]|nr:hypothetical protein CLV76_1112 [Marivita geojedonensis]